VKLNCLIVDDEPLARSLLTDYVQKVSYLNLVDACSSPLTALDLLRRENIDLLFLDIQMPEITGLSLLKTLQKKPLVILTTAYPQYALEGYELDVVDYLLKPITFERFLKAVDKVSQRKTTVTEVASGGIREENAPFVFVKDGTKLVKIRLDDILYVEGLKDYVTIHTKEKKVVTLQRLKTLEDLLPPTRFIRIHHSYIVSVAAIEVIHKGEVQIGGALIPISDSYRKAFREFVEKNQIQ
jgi:two-component system, LytTR family, response regulator